MHPDHFPPPVLDTSYLCLFSYKKLLGRMTYEKASMQADVGS